jgi:hypothetical protein
MLIAQEANMTVPPDKAYPPIATNAAWQKKKSFVDKTKASSKTGLGATLTDAETKWKAIAWAKLDAKALGAKSVDAAEKQLAEAEAALTKVALAKNAVLGAKQQATTASTNNALSATAKTAAGTIVTALAAADKRLGQVNVQDFRDALEKLEAKALISISKITVKSAGKEVATAGGATWDRKVLKVTGITWKVGKSDDYKGKILAIHGETIGSDRHAEGISKVFANDMKIESASGSTATFKV